MVQLKKFFGNFYLSESQQSMRELKNMRAQHPCVERVRGQWERVRGLSSYPFVS